MDIIDGILNEPQHWHVCERSGGAFEEKKKKKKRSEWLGAQWLKPTKDLPR